MYPYYVIFFPFRYKIWLARGIPIFYYTIAFISVREILDETLILNDFLVGYLR